MPVIWSKNTKVIIKNHFAILRFSTFEQINSSHFEIEHSQDGRMYQMIEKIEGEGNTTIENDYEYIHENPGQGINYYRVKQVDYDGQYSYSNVASVKHKIEKQKILIHPNPFNIEINIESENRTILSVFDQIGTIIKEIQLEEGRNELNMNNFKEGIYIFKTDDGANERVVKL